MIKNERQLRITKSQLEKFKSHLALIEQLEKEGKSSLLIKVEQDAVGDQIRELENQITEYESLWASKTPIPILKSFEKFPRALIKARISHGLSQKELAERVGLKEQQIQRYESTEYETASFARIKQLINVLNLEVSSKVQFPNDNITYGDFFRGIKEAGLDNNLIFTRILPSRITAHLQDAKDTAIIDSLGAQAIEYISRIFSLTTREILGQEPFQMNIASLGNVHFKLRKKANMRYTTVYTFYAHYLALIVLQASRHLPVKTLPTNPYEIRKAIIETYGSLELENAVRYIWSLGIPVISLDDSGAFQGAYFRERGRNIILLKSKTKSHARWQFDLFHEFWHATQHPEITEHEIIEIEDFEKIFSKDYGANEEEKEASLFAGAVLLGRSPDKLVQMCMKDANNDLAKLKRAVQNVAKRENVPIDVLANCVAYRLSHVGEKWWGPAENLQEQKFDIPQIVRDVLLEFVDLSQLSEFDLELLMRALESSEENKVKT
jgi:transcriptional regulator with XRE-family HTH domain/Zn-dependent peptidase ImmA (M78 family)